MMFKNLKLAFLVMLLSVLVPIANAELSDKHAAIVEANNRTEALVAEKNYGAALDNAEAAYELSLESLGENDPNTANLAVVYARLLGSTGQKQKASRYYKKAVKIFSSVYGKDSLKAVPAMLGMGEFLTTKKQPIIVQDALAILRAKDPENKLAYADAASYAGEYLAKRKANREVATTILNEALEIYAQEHGENSAELIQPLMLLGNASAKFHNSSGARKYYRRAVKISEKELSEEKHARVLRMIGAALLRYSGSPDAKKYLKRAHRMNTNLFGKDDVRTAMTALELARYQLAAQRPSYAEPLLKEALDVIEDKSNYRNHQLAVLSLLVESYEVRGKRDEATPYCQAIGQIAPWTDTQDYLPIFKKAPKYPTSAVSAGSEGYVIVEYTVDEYGFVTEPQIIKSTGHKSFHAASLEAAKEFRYASAYKNGKAVATTGVRNKFTFNLK